MNRQSGPDRFLAQFRPVDIDDDQLFRPAGEILVVVADLPDVVARADTEYPVGILKGKVARPGADRTGPADGIRRTVRQQIKAVERAQYRNFPPLHKPPERFDTAAEPDSLPRDNHRSRRFPQRRHHGIHGIRRDCRNGFRRFLISRQVIRVDFRRLHIDRDIQPDRPFSAGERNSDRFFQLIPDHRRISHHFRVFRDRPHDIHNVDLLIPQLPQRQFRTRRHRRRKLHLPGNIQHGL